MSDGPSPLADLIRRSPAFASLAAGEVDDLAAAWSEERLAAGGDLIVQGDPAGPAYLIAEGRARVVRVDESTGERIVLGLRVAGDLIGERALLTGAPRMATVRASSDLVVWRIDAPDLEAFLARHPAARADLTLHFEHLGLRTLLKSIRELSKLDPERIRDLTTRLERVAVEAGDEVVRQGEAGDSMYFVSEGRASIRVDGRSVHRVEPGGYFGEGSLLSGDPRTATIVAETPMSLLRLDRATFDGLIGESPAVRNKLARSLSRRLEANTLQERFGIEAGAAAEGESEGEAPDAPAAPEAAPPAAVATVGALTRWWRRRLPALAQPVVLQRDAMDCGPACLATILRHHGVGRSLAWVRERVAGLGTQGSSLDALGRAAEDLGFRVRWTRHALSAIDREGLPAIVHWAGYHYTVLLDIRPERIVMADPAAGVRVLGREDFLADWTGILGELTPTDRLLELRAATRREASPWRRAGREMPAVVAGWLALAAVEAIGWVFAVRRLPDVARGDGGVDLLVAGVLLAVAGRGLRRVVAGAAWRRWRGEGLERYLDRLLHLPAGALDRLGVPDLVRRAGLVERLRSGAVRTLDPLFLSLAGAVVASIALVAGRPVLGLAVVAGHLAAAVPWWLSGRLAAPIGRVAESEGARASTHLTEVLAARRRYEAARLLDWAAGRFDEFDAAAERSSDRARRLVDLGRAAGGIVLGGLWFLVLTRADAPAHALLEMVVLGVATWVLAGRSAAVGALAADLERYGEVADAGPGRPPGPVDRDRGRGPVGLRFEGVACRADGDDRTLRDATLTVEPGECLAIVGPAGLGVALLDLVAGRTTADRGQLVFEGPDGAAIRSPIVHRVGEEPLVLSETIAVNVRASEAGLAAGPDEVRAALLAVGLAPFLRRLPFGEATRLGTLGVGLPLPVLQRVDLARALLARPEVLLLDRPLSAVDGGERAGLVGRALELLARRTTVLWIPAATGEAGRADRVAVLAGGRLESVEGPEERPPTTPG